MASMPHFVPWGPHEVSTKTDFGKELFKHERRPDYNPKANQFPMMLYRAHEVDGKVMCMDVYPKSFRYSNMEMYRMACEAVDNFNLSCQITVNSDTEYNQKRAEGWRDDPKEAYDYAMKLHDDIVRAAAERNYQDRNMSEKARGEIAAAEAATPRVLPEIPEQRTVKLDGRSKEARALKAQAS